MRIDPKMRRYLGGVIILRAVSQKEIDGYTMVLNVSFI